MSELILRRKWTLKAHGKQVVFIKKTNEHSAHVLMKAFLWALYLPDYPDIRVEIGVGDRYKPDVVAVDRHGQPRFWGEAGQVGADKVRSLIRRYRTTHLAIARWESRLDPLATLVKQAGTHIDRTAPVDLLRFPDDSAERFIDDQGHIQLAHADLEWIRIEGLP